MRSRVPLLIALVLLPAGAPAIATSTLAPKATWTMATLAIEPPPHARPPLPHVANDWCTGGFEGMSPSMCYVVPDELRAPRTLLVYLHGVIAPQANANAPMQTYVQSVVERSARAEGVVAIMPRGRRGIGPANLKDYWAWPTTGAAHARLAKELIAEWADARATLEASLGAFERVYLAGSSNGAYFATVLALKGQLDADGYAAISGGMRGGFDAASLSSRAKAPFYVGYGTYEDSADPKSLAELLGEAKWPRMIAEHRVAHGAHEVYMTEAFDFWRRSTTATQAASANAAR